MGCRLKKSQFHRGRNILAQCEAVTDQGVRCKTLAENDTRFCPSHRDTVDWKSVVKTFATGGGALIGNIALPGIGGLIGGGFFGNRLTTWLLEENMPKKIFVSFDFDNDRALKEFIIAQSNLSDSPFSVSDLSLKEAAPEQDWEAKAHRAIARSDIVLVMVGPKTHKASGVLKEVKMARELDKLIVQVIGYKNGNYTAVPNAGRLYKWNWENLKKILG